MRIDILTIFPSFLQPLQLSLMGRAAESGLVDVHVHDLRQWTHDRHRTVDDTPYGGGPGMVIGPEPWGEALDEIATMSGDRPHLVIPTPSGRSFAQPIARQFSTRPWLVFACGRYEGIDARVATYFANDPRWDGVGQWSIGDYVLAGGEVAAMAMIEAAVRLVPGVLGNAESFQDDSFADGPMSDLLEGPVFTKPVEWRGLSVPDVLLTGHHAHIRAWRLRQAQERTAENRPDLRPMPDLPEVN